MTNAGLHSLANELVLQVISNADDASLLSLLLCNRSLGTLLTPILHTRALAPRGVQSAMQWAAMHAHISLITFLLSRGIHPDTGASHLHPPALHSAVCLQRADIATLLLTHGADTNRQNFNGHCDFTPVVHIAALLGDTTMIQLLAAHGANVVAENAMGMYVGTPLHLAVGAGAEGAVRVLLDMGAGLDGEDSGYETPLGKAEGLACEELRPWEVMVRVGEMLVRAGAKVVYAEGNEAGVGDELYEQKMAEFRSIMLAVKTDVDGGV